MTKLSELRQTDIATLSEDERKQLDEKIAKTQYEAQQLQAKYDFQVKRLVESGKDEEHTYRYPDLTKPTQWNYHSNLLIACANEILVKQGREFVIDDCNKPILRFLLYYFNNCPLALNVFPDKQYSLHRNIMLCGNVGAGKTLIMDAFALYLRRTHNPMMFYNVSVTQMLNYYKLNSHLDKYTYNEQGGTAFNGTPVNLCLNDVGLQTQKYYGNDTQLLIDEFFHARNEIWTLQGKYAHITTNLDVKQIKTTFQDEYGRLVDRFKTYNVLHLKGDSKR